MTGKQNNFFSQLDRHKSFDNLTDTSAYKPLPDDWFVGMADIVGSTKLIEAGEYKKINTIGAAVIAAQINGAQGQHFPFVFGGDGASFAFWPEQKAVAEAALAATRRWALTEFDVELRAALVPVETIREAGYDVRVARYSASENADYGMFTGGGISWAEAQMKRDKFAVEIAPVGTQPDLEGLSCRWTPIENQNGVMLSLVISPRDGVSPATFAEETHAIVEMTEELEDFGNPIHVGSLELGLSATGVELEARALPGQNLLLRRLNAFALTTAAWFFMRTGIKVGPIDPPRYRRVTSQNADFRKFEDGLKLTIDCSREMVDRLRQHLESAKARGVIEFGLVEQQSALITCVVPSVKTDDHIHFIDGASGGYAAAASQMKSQRPSVELNKPT